MGWATHLVDEPSGILLRDPGRFESLARVATVDGVEILLDGILVAVEVLENHHLFDRRHLTKKLTHDQVDIASTHFLEIWQSKVEVLSSVESVQLENAFRALVGC